jgi:hypothetical protein
MRRCKTKGITINMTKKHFIALADYIKEHNRLVEFKTGTGLEHLRESTPFDANHIEALADFCQSQNSNFNRERWLEYVAGKCGPNGGAK